MDSTNILNYQGIFLGYFPLRGKAQVIRLLCQYLNIQYRDLFFTPATWIQFKNTQKLNWTFQQIPFLKQGQLVVTDTYPICNYILHRAGRKDLLGINLAQQVNTDAILCDAQPLSYSLTALIGAKQYSPQNYSQAIQKVWAKAFVQKIMKVQHQSKQNFYYDQISLVDFYIYQMIYTIERVCPQKLTLLPKLYNIYKNFSTIPQIKSYQQSKKVIKQISPLKFTTQWKDSIRARGKTL